MGLFRLRAGRRSVHHDSRRRRCGRRPVPFSRHGSHLLPGKSSPFAQQPRWLTRADRRLKYHSVGSESDSFRFRTAVSILGGLHGPSESFELPRLAEGLRRRGVSLGHIAQPNGCGCGSLRRGRGAFEKCRRHQGVIHAGSPIVALQEHLSIPAHRVVRRLCGGPPTAHDRLKPLIGVGSKDPLEQLLAGFTGRDQYVAKPALRDDDHAAKLIGRETGDVVHPFVDVADLHRDRLPFARSPRRRVAPAVEHRLGRLPRDATAAECRPLVLRIPLDPVGTATDAEGEVDLRLLVGRRAGAPQFGTAAAVDRALRLPFAGGLAEERIAEGVEDRRLAGAGGTRKQEQAGRAEPVEVDGLLAGERPEPADHEGVEPHAVSSWRMACSMHSRASTRTSSPSSPG